MAAQARKARAGKRRDAGNGGPLTTRIERKPIAELRLLEVNARYMRHEMFAQLVENIRRDGQLTSIPFAVREPDGGYLVLSGNHRVMAAKEAGLEEIDVLLTDDELDEQRRVALQLSHNAIAGEDDPVVLAQLYEQLEADWRVYSGLDDRELELLQAVQVPGFREAELDFMNVLISFLPEEAERAGEVLETLRREAPADERWAARRADYERFQDALSDVCDAYHIRNLALAFGVLCDVALAHRDDLAAGWLETESEGWWVPLASVFGTDRVPAPLAGKLRKSLERLISAGEVTREESWKALERWVDERAAA
jgi:ParB-like nuclease family protein